MREGVRNFLVGLVSILGLLGLFGLLMMFGELDSFLEPRYEITLHTEDAVGLRPGSTVELNGVPIGTIDEIRHVNDAQYPVRITAWIDERVSIPASAVPFSTSSLLGGASVLQLEAAARPFDATRFLPADGMAVIEGPIRFRVIEQVTRELDARMAPLLEALTKFNELSDTYITFGRNLNTLIEPQSDEAIANGEAPNLHTAMAKFHTILDDARQAFALAREWLGDEQLRADARQAMSKATALIDQASATLDQFTRLADSLEQDAGTIVTQIAPLTEEMSQTLEAVRMLARRASEGEGTVAQLLNNPDLYNSLNEAAIRLERALREFELFIQKAKAEGLPLDL